MLSNINLDNEITIFYVGECPFCTAYIKIVKLKSNFSKVLMVNAREGGEVVERIKKIPLDLDEGMVVKIGDNYFHGHECMNVLSLLASNSGILNRFFAWIFKSETLIKSTLPSLEIRKKFGVVSPQKEQN